MLTRRCAFRQFLLRPDKLVEQIYLYCLAEAAARFSITLYAWTVMSNHHHLVARDNRGNFPEFVAHLHKMIAKAMNAYLGRSENFWAAEQPSVVWTVEPVDTFDKLVYVLANPVADHLVDRVTDWPGVSSLRATLTGVEVCIKRPRVFFCEHGTMPEEVVLRAERPEGFTDLSAEEWERRVLGALETEERVARDVRREENRGIFGRRNVLRAAPTTVPHTVEPRRQLRPTIACGNDDRRVWQLGLLRAFRIAYRAALALWRGGDHQAVFPPGTYKMRWYGAVIAAPV